jgi:hypothetical protein
MAEWYEPDPIMGIMTHTPLANRKVWHLDKWACFTLSTGEDNTKPNIVESSPDRDLYVVARRDENGDKIKLSLRMIHMDDEDMHPVEPYGPFFIKKNENGCLYKCQMFRACNNSIKKNAWVRDTASTSRRSVGLTSTPTPTRKSKASCGCSPATPYRWAPGSAARMLVTDAPIAWMWRTSSTWHTTAV